MCGIRLGQAVLACRQGRRTEPIFASEQQSCRPQRRSAGTAPASLTGNAESASLSKLRHEGIRPDARALPPTPLEAGQRQSYALAVEPVFRFTDGVGSESPTELVARIRKQSASLTEPRDRAKSPSTNYVGRQPSRIANRHGRQPANPSPSCLASLGSLSSSEAALPTPRRTYSPACWASQSRQQSCLGTERPHHRPLLRREGTEQADPILPLAKLGPTYTPIRTAQLRWASKPAASQSALA